MNTESRMIAAGLGLALLVGCESTSDKSMAEAPPPTSAAYERVVEASAVVESVDRDTRMVVLRSEDNRMTTIEAGPEVRNLEQVEPGDRVEVQYVEGVAAALAVPGSTGTPSNTAVMARAPEGGKPGAAIGTEMRTRVRIIAVDAENNHVTFAPEDGIVRNVAVTDPDMQAFAKTLKSGDEVDVVFTEAVAISVVEPNPN